MAGLLNARVPSASQQGGRGFLQTGEFLVLYNLPHMGVTTRIKETFFQTPYQCQRLLWKQRWIFSCRHHDDSICLAAKNRICSRKSHITFELGLITYDMNKLHTHSEGARTATRCKIFDMRGSILVTSVVIRVTRPAAELTSMLEKQKVLHLPYSLLRLQGPAFWEGWGCQSTFLPATSDILEGW